MAAYMAKLTHDLPMHADHLAYFKILLEGRAGISWNAWFKRNEADLAARMPRADFLRLKFNKLDEAERLLRLAGIDPVISPLAKRERYYASLHDNVLDAQGRPLLSVRRGAYDGALGQALDGHLQQAATTLAGFLEKLQQQPRNTRAEILADLCFDGEMERDFGDCATGDLMLKAVAAFASDDDLLAPAMERAKALLADDSDTR